MEYKSRGTFLGWFVGLVMPVPEIFILPWLLQSAQYKIFFLTDTISIYVSPSPTTWAGSRAGPPISEYVFSMLHTCFKKQAKDSSASCAFDYKFLVAVSFLLIIPTNHNVWKSPLPYRNSIQYYVFFQPISFYFGCRIRIAFLFQSKFDEIDKNSIPLSSSEYTHSKFLV